MSNESTRSLAHQRLTNASGKNNRTPAAQQQQQLPLQVKKVRQRRKPRVRPYDPFPEGIRLPLLINLSEPEPDKSGGGKSPAGTSSPTTTVFVDNMNELTINSAADVKPLIVDGRLVDTSREIKDREREGSVPSTSPSPSFDVTEIEEICNLAASKSGAGCGDEFYNLKLYHQSLAALHKARKQKLAGK